jgi:hypothetical protein
MTPDELKVAVAEYYRYEKQFPLVAFEASGRLKAWSIDRADVLVLSKKRELIEIEVKVSRADFRRDRDKQKHWLMREHPADYPPNYFYFAVPIAIANDVSYACDQLYTYAGVLASDGKAPHSTAAASSIHVYREARQLNDGKLSLLNIAQLVKEQSGTLCRLARDLTELKQKSGA